MVDTHLLKLKINETGMPISTVCKRSNINVYTFYNRLKGKGEFTISEVTSLADTLKLSARDRDSIFFAK